MARTLLLLALALAGSGCSSLAAAVSRPRDISSVRPGVTRADAEECLGRPRQIVEGEGCVRISYRLRVLDPRAPAPCRAATNAALVGSATLAAGTASARVFHRHKPLDEAARLAAGAVTFVATDLFLTLKTVVRAAHHRRRDVTVEYDASGRVRDVQVGD